LPIAKNPDVSFRRPRLALLPFLALGGVTLGPHEAAADMSRGAPLPSSGIRFCRGTCERLARGRTSGIVVFDIDNTLVDTRSRTRAAARAFAAEHPWASRLARLSLQEIGRDGRETALVAGLGEKRSEEFHRFWNRFFWRPSSLVHDTPLASTIALARKAKASGAEVYYLTGRVEALKAGTLRQLVSLGLPDADRAHVLCKPRVGVSTMDFKRDSLLRLAGSGRRIGWYMTDSRREIASLPKVAPGVFVDLAVRAPGPAPEPVFAPTVRLRAR
jgi:hypothetical protein